MGNGLGAHQAGFRRGFVGITAGIFGVLISFGSLAAPSAGDLVTLPSNTVLTDQLGNRITILQQGAQIVVVNVQELQTEVSVASGFPVWVSEAYLKALGGQAEVTAEALRARSLPDRGSDLSVLGMLWKGYRAPVLARSNGWVRIQGPASINAYIETSAIGDSDRNPTQQTVKSTPSTEDRSRSTNVSTNSNSASDSTSNSRPSGTSINLDTRRNIPVVNNSNNPSGTRQPVSAQSSNPLPSSTGRPRVAAQSRTRGGGILDLDTTYRLAAGDTVSVSVFGEPDLSVTQTTIPAGGVISFPLIGSVQFAGRTTDQVASGMEASLSGGYVRDAEVTVLVNSYRPIYVRGGVESPGAYAFTEGLTVAKAITLAGGATQKAVFTGVSVTRENQLTQNQLSLDSETRVMPGDIISLEEDFTIIEDLEDVKQFIYVHGEVRSPGEFEYRTGLTAEKAIALAGGFSPRASRAKIEISREVDGSIEPAVLRRVPIYEVIMPGDVISVGTSWF